MDYDDELRHDCDVTGDPLRPDEAENSIDDFEAEMDAELDDIVSDASKSWANGNEIFVSLYLSDFRYSCFKRYSLDKYK